VQCPPPARCPRWTWQWRTGEDLPQLACSPVRCLQWARPSWLRIPMTTRYPASTPSSSRSAGASLPTCARGAAAGRARRRRTVARGASRRVTPVGTRAPPLSLALTTARSARGHAPTTQDVCLPCRPSNRLQSTNEPHRARQMAESFGVHAKRYDRARLRLSRRPWQRIVAASAGCEVSTSAAAPASPPGSSRARLHCTGRRRPACGWPSSPDKAGSRSSVAAPKTWMRARSRARGCRRCLELACGVEHQHIASNRVGPPPTQHRVQGQPDQDGHGKHRVDESDPPSVVSTRLPSAAPVRVLPAASANITKQSRQSRGCQAPSAGVIPGHKTRTSTEPAGRQRAVRTRRQSGAVPGVAGALR